MTSSEIRRSFLDFFREKGHTIVPSSSLLPDSPNLLFTNAGMNQFVPIFLGQAPCPYKPARAADTQKCIRAGGKHNDLEDVGFDTYHHTFFEMLGNWSFGDYFKKEAIAWAWELVVGRWNFPASRIYATVYSPGPGDPASFDQEAHDEWARIFRAAGLDPAIHIVNGNKKDNFWMMGDTGPCGSCSELHVDLTPGARDLDEARQRAGRELVNKGDARCIEIWNLVFIQFNANPDGSFVDLPAKHVDTGMGFERVCSMIQGTKGLQDFSEKVKISNYETDVFRPIFDELEKITGKKYHSTLPAPAASIKELIFHLVAANHDEAHDHVLRQAETALREGCQVRLNLKFRGEEMDRQTEGKALLQRMNADLSQVGVADAEPQLAGKILSFTLSPATAIKEVFSNDVAFRVISDHIRTLSFSIADGIRPSNEGRGYVLRRILRRAVRYGRNLGLREPFLAKLVPILGETMGEIFPEVISQAATIQTTLTQEEESFFRTLERGIEIFEHNLAQQKRLYGDKEPLYHSTNPDGTRVGWHVFAGMSAFLLYDTYGFPLDLTQLMARERGFIVDERSFNEKMDEQKARAKAAQKKGQITVHDEERETNDDSKYEGQYQLRTQLIHSEGDRALLASVVPTETQFYAPMGGQVGDTGLLKLGDQIVEIVSVEKINSAVHHILKPELQSWDVLPTVTLILNVERRAKIEGHHSGTHVLHWALRKVLGPTIGQKGSYVGPDRLRFDFSHGAAMTPAQVAEVEALVNERIAEDAPVSWDERPYAEVKGDPSILQFFGDKYGETVRVVTIGDFSRELCGGTHVKHAAQIGYFKILSEGAIAAGIRRIEAASGVALTERLRERAAKQDETFAGLRSRQGDLAALPAIPADAAPDALAKLIESREELLKAANAAVVAHEKESAKAAEADFQRRAAAQAAELIAGAKTLGEIPFIAHAVADGSAAYLPILADALKARWQGVAVLAAAEPGKVALLCGVAPAFSKRIQAGKVIQAMAPLVGGKGGGRPELAQGGGTNPEGVTAALAKAEELVAAAG